MISKKNQLKLWVKLLQHPWISHCVSKLNVQESVIYAAFLKECDACNRRKPYSKNRICQNLGMPIGWNLKKQREYERFIVNGGSMSFEIWNKRFFHRRPTVFLGYNTCKK